VNPAAASMLGAHAFDLIGRTVHSVVHEERKGGKSVPINAEPDAPSWCARVAAGRTFSTAAMARRPG